MKVLAGQMDVFDCIEQAELEACESCENPEICSEGGFCVIESLPEGAQWDDPDEEWA